MPISGKPRFARSNWAKAPFGTMPLPKLIDGKDHSADFISLELVDSPTLSTCERIAVLKGRRRPPTDR
jgi:hypothetical protein